MTDNYEVRGKYRVEVRDLDGEVEVIFLDGTPREVKRQIRERGLNAVSAKRVGGERTSVVPESPMTAQAVYHGPVAPQFRCPYCQSNAGVVRKSEMTTGSWIFVVVMLLFLCLPLFWIGFFIRKEVTYCRACNMKLTG